MAKSKYKLYIIMVLILAVLATVGVVVSLATTRGPEDVIGDAVTGEIGVIWYDADTPLATKTYPSIVQPNMVLGSAFSVLREDSPCYLRVKVIYKSNGIEITDTSVFTLLDLSPNFVYGADGYYYYIKSSNNRVLDTASVTFCSGIKMPLSFPSTWRESFSITLIADAIQPLRESVNEKWSGANPPQEWLDAVTVGG